MCRISCFNHFSKYTAQRCIQFSEWFLNVLVIKCKLSATPKPPQMCTPCTCFGSNRSETERPTETQTLAKTLQPGFKAELTIQPFRPSHSLQNIPQSNRVSEGRGASIVYVVTSQIFSCHQMDFFEMYDTPPFPLTFKKQEITQTSLVCSVWPLYLFLSLFSFFVLK